MREAKEPWRERKGLERERERALERKALRCTANSADADVDRFI
jgi:hypothetical protein